MAEKLAMDGRSYSDIENGRSACSAVTLVMYIVFVLEDGKQKEELFHILRKNIEEAWLKNNDTS